MNVSIRILRYFATAAHLQSLSKAANSLNISQSAISAAVDTLEAELDLKLFFRKRSQGITLTTIGRNVLDRAQSLLDEYEHFENEVSGLKHGISGELHVACFSAIAPTILTPILEKITSDHPNINIAITEGSVQSVFDVIHRGEVDVGISYQEGDLGAGLRTRELTTLPPHAILPENHRLADRETVSIKDLAKDPLILLDMPQSRQYYTSIYHAAGVKPVFKYRSPNFEMVRSLVSSGLGVALLQTRPGADICHAGNKLIYKPLSGVQRPSTLIVAYTEYTIRRRAVEVFVRYAEDYFRSPAAKKLAVAPKML
jgi:DNA-binding transcriptional LysR family regulator